MNARQRKEIGLPYMVVAWLDGHVRGFSNEQLHRAFRRWGEAGVDYIRIFPFWGDELLPYRRQDSGKFGLNLWFPDYWNELRRFCRIAYQWQIGIYFDLFDNCGVKKKSDRPWDNPWLLNESGIRGIYETRDKAMEHYLKWAEKVIKTVGLRGYRRSKSGIMLRNKPNLFGLGNELDYPGQYVNTRQETWYWADTWGYGLAECMRKLGYKQQILFSGENHTVHALRDYIGPWHNMKFTDTVDQWHGFFEWRPITLKLSTMTQNRWFALSDDGLNVTDGRHYKYPAELDVPPKYKNAHPSVVYHSCKKIKEWLDEHPGKAQWHHIEQLPRSISERHQSIDQLNQDRDVNIYWRIAKRIWGVDIRRTYPKWMRERFL